MNKAFIFDMDGVMVDTERAWIPYEDVFYTYIFGKEIKEKIGSPLGWSLDTIYEKAVSYGFRKKKEDFYKQFNEQVAVVYNEAETPQGLFELVTELKKRDFKLGLVSATEKRWIDKIMSRFQFTFDSILSLHEHPILKHKPDPEGYLEVMRILDAKPENTIILEDSNIGIQSAKASGAFVIGYKEYLLPGYKQEGADIYVETMEDVMRIVNHILPT